MNITGDEKQKVILSLKRKEGLSRILGTSKAVTRLRERLDKIASFDVNVLCFGESGTGKELAARAIHDLSTRCHKPFVPVNCGAIPENLFENELFGHRKGAFTDASFHQEGIVKEAEGGTLFLDEIGVITPYIQVKLLRLLQEKEYKPLGDTQTRKTDIRIVVATNKDLKTMVKEGTFREDLFYRLNIVSIYLPPLRERKEDIPLLVYHFLEKYYRQYGKSVTSVSEEALLALLSYSWPGNIRELENKILHAVVMAKTNEITCSDLDLPPLENQWGEKNSRFESFKEAKQKTIDDFEKKYLTFVLAACRGNVNTAASQAGKSRTAFWNLLARHHLHPRQFERGSPSN
ncbi:MAG: sigma-54 dependent transcriptional regulator [Acidobacteria bacterium]|jgi:two-component system response regulator GlrR|nr:sigma-54 dependent transcriptional regulator [Acidobacteriota bacterium]